MAEVFLARQVNLGRLVVIKQVRSDAVSERGMRAVLDEARVAALLHHPNIVTVLDVGDDAGSPFVALEWVAGKSLREVLESTGGGLPEELALVIALDLLRGL